MQTSQGQRMAESPGCTSSGMHGERVLDNFRNVMMDPGDIRGKRQLECNRRVSATLTPVQL